MRCCALKLGTAGRGSSFRLSLVHGGKQKMRTKDHAYSLDSNLPQVVRVIAVELHGSVSLWYPSSTPRICYNIPTTSQRHKRAYVIHCLF